MVIGELDTSKWERWKDRDDCEETVCCVCGFTGIIGGIMFDQPEPTAPYRCPIDAYKDEPSTHYIVTLCAECAREAGVEW